MAFIDLMNKPFLSNSRCRYGIMFLALGVLSILSAANAASEGYLNLDYSYDGNQTTLHVSWDFPDLTSRSDSPNYDTLNYFKADVNQSVAMVNQPAINTPNPTWYGLINQKFTLGEGVDVSWLFTSVTVGKLDGIVSGDLGTFRCFLEGNQFTTGVAVQKFNGEFNGDITLHFEASPLELGFDWSNWKSDTRSIDLINDNGKLFTITMTVPAQAIPEPATWSLILGGSMLLGLVGRLFVLKKN